MGDRVKMSKWKMALRITLFLCVFLAVFSVLNQLMMPNWRASWNNYDTVYGFYEEPENTIEVVILGTSSTINGFIPMELYENYGICAYNLGTEQQPMLASYYWLEEAYRLHPESLKVVVASPSSVRSKISSSYYRKALDGMHFSSVKFNAVRDYVDDPKEVLSYLVPLFSYHDRWTLLSEEDFEKFGYEPNTYSRGYNFKTTRYMDGRDYDTIAVPEFYVDEQAKAQTPNEEGLYYINKIIDFCDEHDIKLIWVRTPTERWSASWHNTIAGVLEGSGTEFFDMNFLPMLDIVDYNIAVDNMDNWHENFWGAEKITNWLGAYLSAEGYVTDVRGDKRYAFMEEELRAYHANISDIAAMKAASDPAAYLSIVSQMPNCIVFVAAKDEASNKLTQRQRDTFSGIGLPKLASLSYRDSYLAVLNEGIVVAELVDVWNEGDDAREPLFAEGTFGEGHQYAVTSGGFAFGNTASILIDGVEKAKNTRGMNIVVYNYEKDEVVDAVTFDILSYSERVADVSASLAAELEKGTSYEKLTGNVKKLYLYNRKSEDARMSAYTDLVLGEDGLWDFLMTYWDKEDYTLFISVCEDAAGAFDGSARRAFSQIGLAELAQLEPGDSYIGVVDNAAVIYEQRDHGDAPISKKESNYSIVSAGTSAGSKASIKVDAKEYAPNTRGINLVVYDKQLGTVVNQAVFDTSKIAISMP